MKLYIWDHMEVQVGQKGVGVSSFVILAATIERAKANVLARRDKGIEGPLVEPNRIVGLDAELVLEFAIGHS